MKKKLITAVLLLTVSLIAACGSSAETGDAKEASTEGSTEAATETSETAMVEEKSDLPYAEAQGLTFSKLEPVSLDYTAVITDGDYYEQENDPNNYVIDKGKADYTFADVITYPAEQEGFTTAEISYSIDYDVSSHWSSADDYAIRMRLSLPNLFDYYSGQYIPCVKVSSGKETTLQETDLSYGNETWKVSATQNSNDQGSSVLVDWLNDTQYEVDDHHLSIGTLTVTYPNDYDGLCFILKKSPIEYNRDSFMEQISDDYLGFNQDDIGKKILDDTSKEDLIFYTLHDAKSISAKNVSSADDITSKAYGDIIGLTVADSIDNISLPYKFFVINGSAGVLDATEAPANLGTAKYSIGEIKTEDDGDGNTTITIPYQIKYEADIDMSNSDAEELEGRESCYFVEAFDTVTGDAYSAVLSSDDYVDNGEWGDWEDNGHITYHGDIEVVTEVTVPTEKLDTACLIIGDRYGKEGDDYIAFNMDTALAHK